MRALLVVPERGVFGLLVELRQARASISQCGYNTALDLVRTAANRGVDVTYAERFGDVAPLISVTDAARKIVSALPELKYDELKSRLEEDKTFLWVKRGLSPREHDRVNRLGIPGLEFQAEERRIFAEAHRQLKRLAAAWALAQRSDARRKANSARSLALAMNTASFPAPS